MVASKDGHSADLSQLDKFKQAARDLEADEDEARWDARLKKVAKAKLPPEPAPGTPE